MKFFGVKEFFFINLDFKNGYKNEFQDNNEKSCSFSRKRVSRKIDFKAQWLRNVHADSVGVKGFDHVSYGPKKILMESCKNNPMPIGEED